MIDKNILTVKIFNLLYMYSNNSSFLCTCKAILAKKNSLFITVYIVHFVCMYVLYSEYILYMCVLFAKVLIYFKKRKEFNVFVCILFVILVFWLILEQKQ